MRLVPVFLAAILAAGLCACAVVGTAASVAGTAVSVTGSVISTTADVTGDVIGAASRAATGSSEDDSQ